MPTSTRSKRRYEDAKTALATLEASGYAARLAGGCVRDRQLHAVPVDYDIATVALPQDVMRIFHELHRKVIPTGIEHGTVTVVMPSGPVEITTLRKDVDTDGRRATVQFGTSFEEDAARRDFTINAMFEDKEGRVYDYFGGLEHLKQKVLHFVGDPATRIREDYLRILRFFRFWARFDFKPDTEALKAIAMERDGLRIVSQERVTSELLLLLACENPCPALEAMRESGVLQMVIPESKEQLPFDSLRAAYVIAPGWRSLARLTMILPDIPNRRKLEAFLDRLRLSNKQKAIILMLKGGLKPGNLSGQNQAEMMEHIDHWENVSGSGAFLSLILPTWRLTHPEAGNLLDELERVEKELGILRKTPLPISGLELKNELGIPPGPAMGKILDQLKREFRNRKWSTASEGIKRAKTLYGK